MRIGLLLPSILASKSSLQHRIFAPLFPAIDLANGLVDKGHEVTFYSAADVETKATVVSGNMEYVEKDLVYDQFKQRDELERKYTEAEIKKRDFENMLTMRAYQDAKDGKLDIIHSYHDFSAHYFDELTKFPTVYTLHNPLPQTTESIEYERFRMFEKHHYVSISLAQRKSTVELNFVANIYHGIDLSEYAFSETSEDHLVFIGRMLSSKGVDIALQVSKDLGKGLQIATSSSTANTNESFYKEKIEPFLDDDHRIIETMLHGKEKAAFLGKGKAFLFPMQWEEPFGLVMIEAMAAGTPVISFARGSAPEIIEDGVSGFLINSSDEDKRGEYVIKETGIEGLRMAVDKLFTMSMDEYASMRKNARKRVEEKFTNEKMVEEYEEVYTTILSS